MQTDADTHAKPNLQQPRPLAFHHLNSRQTCRVSVCMNWMKRVRIEWATFRAFRAQWKVKPFEILNLSLYLTTAKLRVLDARKRLALSSCLKRLYLAKQAELRAPDARKRLALSSCLKRLYLAKQAELRAPDARKRLALSSRLNPNLTGLEKETRPLSTKVMLRQPHPSSARATLQPSVPLPNNKGGKQDGWENHSCSLFFALILPSFLLPFCSLFAVILLWFYSDSALSLLSFCSHSALFFALVLLSFLVSFCSDSASFYSHFCSHSALFLTQSALILLCCCSHSALILLFLLWFFSRCCPSFLLSSCSRFCSRCSHSALILLSFPSHSALFLLWFCSVVALILVSFCSHYAPFLLPFCSILSLCHTQEKTPQSTDPFKL